MTMMTAPTSTARSARTTPMRVPATPDSRLYRKAAGREAKLCYMGHATMENRHGLAVAEQGHACQWHRRTPGFGDHAEGETQSRRPPHHGR